MSSQRPLPLLGTGRAGDAVAAPQPAMPDAVCEVDDGCITCGDLAVVLVALEDGDGDVRCGDPDGREEIVAVDVVGPVTAGDHLLVHARVALEVLGPEQTTERTP